MMQGEEMKRLRKHLGMTQGDFGKALGLSATFVGLMERGAKPIEDRTALAARQLFNDRGRLAGDHCATEMPGDVQLADASILWDEEPQRGVRVRVVGRGQDDQAFSSSYGACNDDWEVADDVGRLLRLLGRFVELTVQEKIAPAEVHEAFSVIPQYRECLHASMFKEGVAFE